MRPVRHSPPACLAGIFLRWRKSAIGIAVLYGLHQVFIRMACDRFDDRDGFVADESHLTLEKVEIGLR